MAKVGRGQRRARLPRHRHHFTGRILVGAAGKTRDTAPCTLAHVHARLGRPHLSLLGLIRHLAKVERIWFRQRAASEQVEGMYDSSRGKDVDFDDLDPGEAEAAVARLRDEWRLADEAAPSLAFDDTFDVQRRRLLR